MAWRCCGYPTSLRLLVNDDHPPLLLIGRLIVSDDPPTRRGSSFVEQSLSLAMPYVTVCVTVQPLAHTPHVRSIPGHLFVHFIAAPT